MIYTLVGCAISHFLSKNDSASILSGDACPQDYTKLNIICVSVTKRGEWDTLGVGIGDSIPTTTICLHIKVSKQINFSALGLFNLNLFSQFAFYPPHKKIKYFLKIVISIDHFLWPNMFSIKNEFLLRHYKYIRPCIERIVLLATSFKLIISNLFGFQPNLLNSHKLIWLTSFLSFNMISYIISLYIKVSTFASTCIIYNVCESAKLYETSNLFSEVLV